MAERETPWRATLEEAMADAVPDWLLYGTIYVIRGADGRCRRLDPTRVRYDAGRYTMEVGTMGERPTPEEIASTYKGGVKVLRRLEQYGYRIVHESDPPMIEVTDFDEVDPRFVEGSPPKVRLDPEWSVAP